MVRGTPQLQPKVCVLFGSSRLNFFLNMLTQVSENMRVRSAEEEKTETASTESQSSHSQLSQIYFEQWEKENLKQKPQEKPVTKKSGQKIMKMPHKKRFGGKISKDNKQFKIKNEEKIQHGNEDRKFEELIAENNKLKKNLEHSRRVCRELVEKLRDERSRKRFKREDFEMIKNIFNRYM